MVIIVSRQNGYKEVQRLFLSESIMPAAVKQRMSVSRGLVVLGNWNSANSSQVLFQSQMATACPASFFPWYEKNESVASASVPAVRKSWWPRTGSAPPTWSPCCWGVVWHSLLSADLPVRCVGSLVWTDSYNMMFKAKRVCPLAG